MLRLSPVYSQIINIKSIRRFDISLLLRKYFHCKYFFLNNIDDHLQDIFNNYVFQYIRDKNLNTLWSRIFYWIENSLLSDNYLTFVAIFQLH